MLKQRLLRHLMLYTFALAFYGWDELAISSGGENFNLTNNSEEMYNSLMGILDDICAPNRAEQGAFMSAPQGYIPASFSEGLFCY